MSGPRNALRPQDILIALKLSLLGAEGDWTQAQVAQSLGISPTEVAFALQRLKKHHLLSEDKRSIKAGALCEFLVHGLKYVFPAELGTLARGMPTAAGHTALRSKIRTPPDHFFVWPDAEGKVRGQSLEPLYNTVPFAAKQDPKLHDLLSLIDAIRVGGARETALARRAIESHLLRRNAA